MELLPPGAPVPDPFLAALRARHPDVDLVLLGPDPAAAGGSPDEPDDAAAERAVDGVTDLVDDVRDRSARLWAAVGAGVEPAEVPPPRVATGPVPATVVVRAGHGVLLPGRPGALDAVAERLARDGWALRGSDGAVRVLTGRRGAPAPGLVLRATYAAATGALVVRLETAPLRVGTAAARRLVRS